MPTPSPISTMIKNGWRRLDRRPVLATVLLTVLCTAIGWIATLVQTPVYQSNATLGLAPVSASQAADVGQLSVAAPLYSEAVAAPQTRQRAEELAGHRLGTVDVRTFRETPIIFQVVASAQTADLARETADAYIRAVQERSEAGEILPRGTASVRLISAPTLPPAAATPRTGLTVAAAAGIGLVLGLAAFRPWRRRGDPPGTAPDRAPGDASAGGSGRAELGTGPWTLINHHPVAEQPGAGSSDQPIRQR